MRNVTVSHWKSLLPPSQECIKIEDKYKIQNIGDCSNNPFVLARNMSIATGIRSFKFRLLHKDIFSKNRLHKIKLVENNFCDFCLQSAEINEDINLLLWECPGSRETWDNLQQILTELNIEYQVSFKSIIMGIQNAPISVELIVMVIAHLLARKCRPKSLIRDQIKREITNLMKTKEFIAKKVG
jgi:hypothetical protein